MGLMNKIEMHTKSAICGLGLLALIGLPHNAKAHPDFSVELNGQYARPVLNVNSVGHKNGAGTSLEIEVLPIDTISLGIGTGIDGYFGSSTSFKQTNFFDAIGKIMPWGTHNDFSLYATGGIGIDPLSNLPNARKGNYNAFAGIGNLYKITNNFSFDTSARFDYLTPVKKPFEALTVSIGIRYSFDSNPIKNRVESSIQSHEIKLQKETLAKTTETTSTKTSPEVNNAEYLYVMPKDNLWRTALRAYNDNSKWPEIYKANKDQIKDPNVIEPGQRLVIPTPTD